MTISLLESCFMNDVNLGDVSWMLDVLFSPPVHQLRKSVDLVVLPSDKHRDKFEAVVSLLLFVHSWLWHDLSAMDYVHFLPLDKIAVVRKYGVFNAAKADLIRSIVL